jgi:ABC-2 type transport system ATP-binding protein
MDEPTSSLDEAARDRIEDLIRDLNRRARLTIVLVSHDLGQGERLGDRVILLAGGRLEGVWSER